MARRITCVLLWVALQTLTSGTLFAQERWAYRYNGPGDYWDAANSIAMGPDGNLYCAGYSEGTGTLTDFTVVSLAGTGVERWVYRYSGPGDYWDAANSIVVGSDSNVYVAGHSHQSRTCCDAIVTSLSASGDERWVYRHEYPGDHLDRMSSIVVGPDANLYAAGRTSSHFTVLSLTDSGTERWTHEYQGPAGSRDYANSIIMGADGNLYAVGSSIGSGTRSDFTVLSLTDSGAERWVYRYNGPEDDLDYGVSIVMGTDGNVYAAGSSVGTGTSSDFIVVSLTASGAERWVYRYNGPGNDLDYGFSIVMGVDGNLYAAGSSIGSGTLPDFVVVSLTPSGGERWIYRCHDPGNHWDRANSIVAGADGNLYAVGRTCGTGITYELTVVSLTPSGTERWVYWYDGPANDYDEGFSIIMGTDGNVYAAGLSVGSGTDQDLTVVSLTHLIGVDVGVISLDLPPDTVFVDSSCGVKASVRNFGSDMVKFDVVATIDGYVDTVRVENLDPGASTSVTFRNWQVPPSDSTTYRMTVCVYAVADADTTNDRMQKTIFACNPLGVGQEPRGSFVPEFGMSQNSPNPFNRSTVISYGLPVREYATLSIHDASGRLVRILADQELAAGWHSALWDGRDSGGSEVPGGVYFCKLRSRGFSSTRKMVLLR